MSEWTPILKPDCECTHTLSLFCATLVSTTKPETVLPGVECHCGKTWLRLKDNALFRVPSPNPNGKENE
jgi:hypothetical protein